MLKLPWMKKYYFLFILSLFSFKDIFATHISGGEMIYEYLGPGGAPNTKQYRITLRLFRDDAATAQGGALMPTSVSIGIFNNDNNSQFPGTGQYYNVGISNGTGGESVNVDPAPVCMVDPPNLAYHVGYYSFTVDLPNNNKGYTATYQTCCRIFPLQNVFTQQSPAQGEGSTYVCTISGNNLLPFGNNSSPQFSTQLTRVCHDNPFTFDFSATDPDGDSLVYYFCNAYNRGTAVDASFSTPAAPPYFSVSYINGYAGYNPLGSAATINSKTGIISGIAPSTGRYVVCVCINEYRNGVLIGYHRKDFILGVYDCDIPSAKLDPFPTTCDGFTVSFQNNGSEANIQNWFWTFGDPASGSLDTSYSQTPTHTFTTAGDYTIHFVVNRGLPCSDSTTALVKVYPGFFPGFDVNGQCANTPIKFKDATTTNYGIVTPWTWDFGDPTSGAADSSHLQNPTHTYATAGTYHVVLNVGNSKGCVGTFTRDIVVTDHPPLTVSNDTLICSLDTLQLHAVGSGSFLWTPNYMINDVTSPDPLVSPDVSTTYKVTLTDAFGCIGSDTVRVDVVSFVTLFKPNDSTICAGDPVILKIVSDALQYSWTPTGSLNDPTLKNPIARPTTPTTYHVVANIGKCEAQADININTVPYPSANAGLDQEICFGNSTQLQASGGSIYLWSPSIFLDNPRIANPHVVKPTAGVQYVVTVRDTIGCPKAVRDTVIVNVDRVIAYLGNTDTSVVLGQPLQLLATGGINYLWTPSTWLDDPNIPNPISLPQDNIQYFVRVSNSIGCFANGSIRVHLYKIPADIYVPTAFSPTGLNKLFVPILRGVMSLDLFRVYNRWGQLLYSNPDPSTGWDGTFGGKPQDAGTYVWYAEATDYKGVKIKKKGYVVLIR